jgi:hypothetical protein
MELELRRLARGELATDAVPFGRNAAQIGSTRFLARGHGGTLVLV